MSDKLNCSSTALRLFPLQAGVRGMLARSRARHLRQQRSALLIQRNWRMAYQRFKYWQIRTAVLHIQAAWRGHVARSEASELRQEIAYGTLKCILHMLSTSISGHAEQARPPQESMI